MSKEMLEAFRILEEDKGIKKEDIIEAVTESLRSAYKRRYGRTESAAIEFDEKKETSMSTLFGKSWMKSLTAAWKFPSRCLGHLICL